MNVEKINYCKMLRILGKTHIIVRLVVGKISKNSVDEKFYFSTQTLKY